MTHAQANSHAQGLAVSASGPVWVDLFVGGGDTSQDTDSNVTASNPSAGTYTVDDVASATPAGRRRDVVECTDFTGTGLERISFEIAYGGKPIADASQIYDGFLIMSADSDAGIKFGGGCHFSGSNSIPWRVTTSGLDTTGSGITRSSFASLIGVVEFQSGRARSLHLMIKNADGTDQRTSTLDLGSSVQFTSLFIARVTGRESNTGATGAENLTNTRSRWRYEAL